MTKIKYKVESTIPTGINFENLKTSYEVELDFNFKASEPKLIFSEILDLMMLDIGRHSNYRMAVKERLSFLPPGVQEVFEMNGNKFIKREGKWEYIPKESE